MNTSPQFVPVDPNELHTIEMLRAELVRVNGELRKRGKRLALADEVGRRMFGVLWTILKAYVRRDAIALIVACETYLLEFPQLRERLEEEAESMNAQVH